LCGSKSHRCSSGDVPVLVDDSGEDADALEPVSLEVVHGIGLVGTAAQIASEVTGLLGRPLRGWVRSDAGDVELTGVMLEERARTAVCR
jgi:hypothetical protein